MFGLCASGSECRVSFASLGIFCLTTRVSCVWAVCEWVSLFKTIQTKNIDAEPWKKLECLHLIIWKRKYYVYLDFHLLAASISKNKTHSLS